MSWRGWMLPIEMASDNSNEFEKRLWDAADQLRANSKLMPSQYSGPVLGLIFLKFADHRFQNATHNWKQGAPLAEEVSTKAIITNSA